MRTLRWMQAGRNTKSAHHEISVTTRMSRNNTMIRNNFGRARNDLDLRLLESCTIFTSNSIRQTTLIAPPSVQFHRFLFVFEQSQVFAAFLAKGSRTTIRSFAIHRCLKYGLVDLTCITNGSGRKAIPGRGPDVMNEWVRNTTGPAFPFLLRT
mmetsp:Transcript_9236/g.22445  ORF Transcript_9236/g.22445 Transcript_9236/m.22445 type:complete len:153 (-) Transcript_9236:1436-1894(-)